MIINHHGFCISVRSPFACLYNYSFTSCTVGWVSNRMPPMINHAGTANNLKPPTATHSWAHGMHACNTHVLTHPILKYELMARLTYARIMVHICMLY